MKRLAIIVLLLTWGLCMSAKPDIDRQAALDALMTVADSCPEGRMALAKHSPRYFASRYLDINLWDCQERWIDRLDRMKQGLILAPCGHGKTESIAITLPLRKHCYNRDLRTLICSKADDLALKNLGAISDHLRYNQKITGDFGPFWSRKARRWDQHQIYSIRPNRRLKDPSFEAVGLNSAVTGGRFDLIVLDDIIDVLNVQSATQRLKTREYIRGTLIPRLEPWGQILAIGTRKHPDDFYGTCLKDHAWTCLVDPAIIREPAHKLVPLAEPELIRDPLGHEYFIKHGVEFLSDDRGECLAPEKWTMEELLRLRAGITLVPFNREYQNVVSSDETALFKLVWLEQCRDEALSYVVGNISSELKIEYLAIIQGADTALVPDVKEAEARDSDYTVVWTVGVRRDGTIDLLGLLRQRGLSPDGVEKAIEAEYNRFQPDFLMLETNSFGIIHAHNLIKKSGLRLVKHHTGSNKSDLYKGIPSLAVVFENKLIRLPYQTEQDRQKTQIIISEFFGLGTEPHDDTVLAAWIAQCGVDRWKVGQRKMQSSVAVHTAGGRS